MVKIVCTKGGAWFVKVKGNGNGCHSMGIRN